MTTEQPQTQPGTTPDETPGTALPPDAQPDESDAPPQDPSEGDEGDADEAGELPPDAVEQTPDEPPAVPGAVSDKEIEKAFKTIGRAAETYSRKVGEAMGEAATQLEPCPRCSGSILGFIFPPAFAPPDADTKAAVLVSVGEEPPLATKQDPYSRRCETCDGSGSCTTGAKLNTQKAIRCLPCDGRGWVPVGDERRADRSGATAEALAAGESVVPQVNGEAPQQTPDVDLWGRPAGHPDYGVHPMYLAQR